MASILDLRDKHDEALKVYERVLAIAPHWKSAEDAADKLKATIAGQELRVLAPRRKAARRGDGGSLSSRPHRGARGLHGR